jgi:hypothetical protein
MRPRLISRLFLLLLLSAFLQAQSRGHGTIQPSFAQPIGISSRSLRRSPGEFRQSRPLRNSALIFGDPYLYDYVGYPSEALPQQAPAQAAVSPVAPPPKAAEPLMLEWQGDRWVRVSPIEESEPSKPATELRPLSVRNSTPSPAPPPPDTVLVFADGHQEEVSRYTIVGKVMYANADYWATGNWTKKISLSSLNLPASLQANQQRGSKLVLPTGPNEVVLGP